MPCFTLPVFTAACFDVISSNLKGRSFFLDICSNLSCFFLAKIRLDELLKPFWLSEFSREMHLVRVPVGGKGLGLFAQGAINEGEVVGHGMCQWMNHSCNPTCAVGKERTVPRLDN